MKYLVLLIMGCFTLAGCKKAPINSDIEGHWQLIEYTTQTDGVNHPCERIYYSIQLWVVEVAEKGGNLGLQSFRGRYYYDETTNKIHFTDMSTYATPENSRPATVEELLPYGLNNVNTELEVLEKGRKRLVLRSDYATLYLKRF